MKHSPTIKDSTGRILDSLPNDRTTRRLFDGSAWYYSTTATERVQSDATYAAGVVTYKAGLPANAAYKIGCYYFPGWVDGGVAARPLPWELLDEYPERWPMQGKYQEGSQYVAENQLRQMAYAGIDFMAVDWYWNGATFLNNAVDAFKIAIPAISSPVKYCLMWDNSLSGGTYPTTLTDWQNIYTHWITTHFKDGAATRPAYHTIDGKPVVILFSPDALRTRANALYPAYAASETATLQMLTAANDAAIAAGLTGIYFVGCMRAQNFWVGAGKYMANNGYSAQTAYLTHYELSDHNTTAGPLAHTYSDLDQINQSEWAWNIENGSIPYFVPVASGWDRRPWGGSGVAPYNDAAHDNCTPTEAEWSAHLVAAKQAVDANQGRTANTLMVYAWNELGEGGYIEPTQGRRVSFLDQIKSVFST